MTPCRVRSAADRILDPISVAARRLFLSLAVFACLATASEATPDRDRPAVSPVRPITPAGLRAREPAWSPDGERIAFRTDSLGPCHIWIASADSAGKVTSGDVHDGTPSWSPDGHRIAFSRRFGRDVSICVVADTGGAVTRLTADPARHDWAPTWSPDGREVAFVGSTGMLRGIWIAPVEGGPARCLHSGSGRDADPDWSPDGTSVAFASAETGGSDIWIAPVAGGSPRRITTDPAYDVHPSWSPDGQRLAFSSSRTGREDIWIVGVSDGSLTRLTTDPVSDSEPDWSPRGDRIAFVSERSGEIRIWSFDVTEPLRPDEPSSGVEVSGEILRCAYDFGIRLDDGTVYLLTNAKDHGIDTVGVVVRCVIHRHLVGFSTWDCSGTTATVERVIERLPGIPAGAGRGTSRRSSSAISSFRRARRSSSAPGRSCASGRKRTFESKAWSRCSGPRTRRCGSRAGRSRGRVHSGSDRDS
jgi:dipeptidyl aminopeptidase/acylaminoacyl peptidase